MNELDDVKRGFSGLSGDIQSLSQSIKAASLNVQQTAVNVTRTANVASMGGVGMAAGVMSPMYPSAMAGAFSGVPTAAAPGQFAPMAKSSNSMFTQLFTQAGNNEYNKGTSWWRDTMAVFGKQYVDRSSEDAKRIAGRNWGYRGQQMGADAVGAALWATNIGVGAAYEFVVKPIVMEPIKRTHERMGWWDQVSRRNVSAKVSNQAGGGMTESELRMLSSETQGMHVGSGFTKKQWDALTASAEGYGYFKTYDKFNVDAMVRKHEKLRDDAKYVMQALHSTADEAAKILGDFNQLSGRGSVTKYIGNINAASAYTGLSGTQLNEYAVGRSEYYKGLGYSGKAGADASLIDIINYYKNSPNGTSQADVNRGMNLTDQIVGYTRSGNQGKFILGAFFRPVSRDGGGTEFDMDLLNKFNRGEVTSTELIKRAQHNARGYDTITEQAMSSGGLTELFYKKSGLHPTQARVSLAKLGLSQLFSETMVGGDYNMTLEEALSDPRKDEIFASFAAKMQDRGYNVRGGDDIIKMINGSGLIDHSDMYEKTLGLRLGLPDSPMERTRGFKRGRINRGRNEPSADEKRVLKDAYGVSFHFAADGHFMDMYNSDMEKIFKATPLANDYGRRYVAWLKNKFNRGGSIESLERGVRSDFDRWMDQASGREAGFSYRNVRWIVDEASKFLPGVLPRRLYGGVSDQDYAYNRLLGGDIGKLDARKQGIARHSLGQLLAAEADREKSFSATRDTEAARSRSSEMWGWAKRIAETLNIDGVTERNIMGQVEKLDYADGRYFFRGANGRENMDVTDQITDIKKSQETGVDAILNLADTSQSQAQLNVELTSLLRAMTQEMTYLHTRVQ